MQFLVALLYLALIGPAVSAQSCTNEDGITTTNVINPAVCGCPGPTDTEYESTATQKSTADCGGCSDIAAFTFAGIGCPRLPCVGFLASATATVIISGPPTTVTQFICSPTPFVPRPRGGSWY